MTVSSLGIAVLLLINTLDARNLYQVNTSAIVPWWFRLDVQTVFGEARFTCQHAPHPPIGISDRGPEDHVNYPKKQSISTTSSIPNDTSCWLGRSVQARSG